MTMQRRTIRQGFMVVALAGGIVFQAQATEVTQTPVPIDTEKSCQELYLEVEALLAVKDDAAAGFWNEQNNQVAGAAGLAFKPAWFYLGYAAIKRFQDKQGSNKATRRIAALRNALADKLCFVQ